MTKHEFEVGGAAGLPESLKNDLRRALRDRSYESDGEGQMVLAGDTKVKLGGAFKSSVGRHPLVQTAIDQADAEKEEWARQVVASRGWQKTGRGYREYQSDLSYNVVPDGGINHVLDVVMPIATGYSQVTSWYVATFKNNTTPSSVWLSNWAGASSGPLGTELTQAEFDETARQAATWSAAAAKSKAMDAVVEFTLATGVSGVSLYGATLNSVATIGYDAADEHLLAATRFTNPKTGLGATDKAQVLYTITGTST